jgi:hypothetical protein
MATEDRHPIGNRNTGAGTHMNRKLWLALVVAISSLTLSWVSGTGQAADRPEPGREVCEKLLFAIIASDYDLFMSEGDEVFKNSLPRERWLLISKQYAPRLKAGYTNTFLTEMRQQGCQVTLWKLTYKDGGDDALVRLIMLGGKVVGFVLQ